MNTLNYFGSQSVSDWRGMVDHLKKAHKEFENAYPIMTPYERASISHSITEKRDQYLPTIRAGVFATHKVARDGVLATQARLEAERQKITNSWEPSKLAAEMQVYSMRIDHATKSDAGHPDLGALQAIYTEAKGSGDKYKARAAAEALQSLVSKIPHGLQDSHATDMRFAANRMAKQAGRDLDALKITPGLVAAVEEANKKIDDLKAVESLVKDTGDVLGEVNPNGTWRNSPFIKLLDSITQGEDGKFSVKEE